MLFVAVWDDVAKAPLVLYTGRIYLGIHSLIDVVAGIIFGLVTLALWLMIHEYVGGIHQHLHPQHGGNPSLFSGLPVVVLVSLKVN
ncbi:hypothetical protein BHM03_00052549 [Ensete ventricosum]|nr:hypothetical protein BHM03_00052549 [Ensete ventricosum]